MEQIATPRAICSGCAACAHVCRNEAIRMQADTEGFLYPRITPARCVDCGACREVCASLRPDEVKHDHGPTYYAAKHQNPVVLKSSTSGGVFTALSNWILRRDGVVYGAVFDETLRVCHERTEDDLGRARMRFAKYVQSELGTLYGQLLADLAAERPVLFSGTPCQTAAVWRFMAGRAPRENLYLCDLLCFGVASPRLWRDYLALLEQEHGKKVVQVFFRNKLYDWRLENVGKTFLYGLSGEENLHLDDRFTQLIFEDSVILRPCCADCRYTDTRRPADITLGDCWGIEKYAPQWYDNRGLSLVITNSPKGEQLLDDCRPELTLIERPEDEMLAEHPRLAKPLPWPAGRARFWRDYAAQGLAAVLGPRAAQPPVQEQIRF